LIKNFFKSTYVKATAAFVAGGLILLLCHHGLQTVKLSAVIAKINDTLLPVYIGIFMAFIFCPVYNWFLKHTYLRLIKEDDLAGDVIDSVYYGNSRPSGQGVIRMHKRKMKVARVVASICVLLIIIAVIAFLAYFIIPQLITSVVSLTQILPEKLNTLADWSEIHLARFPSVVERIRALADAGAVDAIEWVQVHFLNTNYTQILTQISTGMVSIVNTALDLIIGILISMYLLNYKERLFAIGRKFMAANFSKQRSEKVKEFFEILNETFINFIVGRVLDAMVIGFITFIAMTLLHIPLAVLVSVIVGITNIIPFFGPFLGAIPSFCLLLIEDPIKALYFLVLILLIQQLDGNVIGPKIVGNKLNINSFWILLAVLIGGGLFGLLGMIFGVPVFAVIYRYLDKYTGAKLAKRGRSNDTMDYYDFEKFGATKDDILEENDTF
jgi:predicted PurR-regulated permease PerM